MQHCRVLNSASTCTQAAAVFLFLSPLSAPSLSAGLGTCKSAVQIIDFALEETCIAHVINCLPTQLRRHKMGQASKHLHESNTDHNSGCWHTSSADPNLKASTE